MKKLYKKKDMEDEDDNVGFVFLTENLTEST